MEQLNMLSTNLRDGRLPRFISTYKLNETQSAQSTLSPHAHKNELELLYVYRGDGRLMVDNRDYPVSRGDIVVCNAGVLHGASEDAARCIYAYSIALTDVAFRGLPDNWLCDRDTMPVISTGLLADQLGQTMELLYELACDLSNLAETCNCLAATVLLLAHDLLLSRERHESATTRMPASALAHRAQRYLDRHYREPVTLQSVGKALHISEYYLAHVFKEEIGMPPMQYVMKRRIGEAQSLLINTMLPIADIAQRLSYNSPCHFNTMFNKYVGMPPGKYRQSFRTMAD